ncbi:MAG TPA: hypothetical protein DEH78_32975, partial [Solibacterales bacterium]|nr:hypothetical protein [Bryobacterales bacterium]
MRAALVLIVATLCAAAEPPGRAALRAFQQWKQRPANAVLEWDESLSRYRASLRAAGLSERAAERTMRLIAAYDEADLYNRVYTGAPSFNTQPNRFLVEAAAAIPAAGSALDAGMGQGRNALFLASKGWKVTGFDVAEAGLRAASARAA